MLEVRAIYESNEEATAHGAPADAAAENGMIKTSKNGSLRMSVLVLDFEKGCLFPSWLTTREDR